MGRVVLFLFLALASLAVCPEVAAREAPGAATGPEKSPVPPAAVAPAPPAPIPLEEISARAVDTTERLRAILTELRQDVSIRQLEREIPPILESIAELKSAQAALDPSQLTGRAVASLRQECLLDEARLEGVEKNLARRVQALLRFREEVRQTSDLWERSEAAARAEAAPGPLMEQADAVLRLCRQVEASLGERLVPILALRKRANEAQLTVAEGMEWVEAASEEVKRDLMRLDSPPLWKAFGGTARREATSPFRQRFTGEVLKRSLGAFAHAYRGEVKLHVAVAAGFLIFLLRLRRGARKEPVVPAGSEAEAVIARPISTALLVGLLATLVIYPRAPTALLELVSAASILPALVLLPRLVTLRGKRALFCLLAIFLALRIVAAVMEDPLATRIAILGISLSGILLLSWWLRPGSPFRALPPPRRDVPPGAAKAALAILVAAFALNVIGNVSLAWLLTAGTVNSAYLAMMLYLAFLLIQGLVAVLVASRPARTLNVVRLQGDLIRRHVTRWTSLAALLLWAYFTAAIFGLSGPLLGWLTTLMTTRWKLGMVTVSPGSILVFGVTLWFSVLLSRLVSFILAGDVFPRLGLGRGVPEIVSMMVRYGLITAGFLLAVAAAGVEMGQFAIIAGALGVGIGFGLQNIVSNFISGLILMFERPIRVNDTIQVGNLLGQVRHIGVRGSTLRTPEGADVIVPNANLISGEVVNWTLSDAQRRMEIQVGVAYGTDPGPVLALLEQVAAAHPEVLPVPAPQPLFIRFGESSLDFSLRFWTDRFDDWVRVQSEVAVRVHDALRDAGIKIPFPQRDLHLHPADGTDKPGTPPV